jgi:capsular exopolysaccharide synthesis family protein
MSLATLDLPRTASAFPDAPAASNNIFLAALRRWPLLILGLIVGLGGGFLVYSVQAPKYQSTAQIAIYKKNLRTSTGDLRMGVFEDYISAQIDTIRSQKILGAAAKNPQLNNLTTPMPQDRYLASEKIKLGFNVTRSKETSGGGMAISPVVNLTYTDLDPQDSQLVLQAVIDTYVKELSAAYSAETLERLTQNKATTDRNIERKNLEEREKSKFLYERSQITSETEDALMRRISISRDQIQKLTQDIVKLKTNLALIAATGPNRSDRLATLATLGFRQGISTDTSTNSPEVQIQLLKAQKSQLSEQGLGKDHEKVKAMDAQINFWVERQKQLNPEAKSGAIDELYHVELQLKNDLKIAEEQKKNVEADFASDVETHRKSSDLTIKANTRRDNIEALNKEIAMLERERINIESTETIGGFNAQQLIEPQAGRKVSPVLFQWLALGGLLGTMMGFGLGVLVELGDKGFRSPAEIRNRLGVPVIGHIPAIRIDLPSEADVPEEYSNTLVSARRPKSIEAESYRGVRTQLSVITANSGHQVIQVTSPNPGDGKSTLAANLAISLAQSGKKTVLLDCDFRKPRVHKLFAIAKPELGLASVTGGLANLSQAIRHSSIDNLDILPCGPRPQNPAELLSGARFQEVLAELRKMYDYVIVDTPPMLAVSDPRVVAQRVDGILLVFKITKRARPLAERAREQLADMGANLLGVIVNGGGNRSGDQYGYSYGYNYAYSYEYEYAETYVDVDEPTDPNGSGKIVL